MSRKQLRHRSEHGFTIIELMIALSILAAILLLCSAMLISLGSMFTKGTNQANTQNAARNTMNDLSYSFEFSSAPISTAVINNSKSWCFGTTRYTFVEQKQLGSQVTHAMWKDTLASGAVCTGFDLEAAAPSNIANDPNAVSGSGTEMVLDNMGIAYLNYVPLANGTNDITLIVSYGKFGSGDFSGTGVNTQCSGGPDSRFCATAVLQRTVSRRL
jgi:prepilin-type N-terminal cleavage/methylation domain-containing protein